MTVVCESSAHAGAARVATSAASTDSQAHCIVFSLAVNFETRLLVLTFGAQDEIGQGWWRSAFEGRSNQRKRRSPRHPGGFGCSKARLYQTMGVGVGRLSNPTLKKMAMLHLQHRYGALLVGAGNERDCGREKESKEEEEKVGKGDR